MNARRYLLFLKLLLLVYALIAVGAIWAARKSRTELPAMAVMFLVGAAATIVAGRLRDLFLRHAGEEEEPPPP